MGCLVIIYVVLINGKLHSKCPRCHRHCLRIKNGTQIKYCKQGDPRFCNPVGGRFTNVSSTNSAAAKYRAAVAEKKEIEDAVAEQQRNEHDSIVASGRFVEKKPSWWQRAKSLFGFGSTSSPEPERVVRVPVQGAFGYQVPPPGVAAAATTTAPTTTASTVVQEFDAYRDMFESDLNAAENRALHMNIFGPTGKGKTVGAVNFLNKLQPRNATGAAYLTEDKIEELRLQCAEVFRSVYKREEKIRRPAYLVFSTILLLMCLMFGFATYLAVVQTMNQTAEGANQRKRAGQPEDGSTLAPTPSPNSFESAQNDSPMPLLTLMWASLGFVFLVAAPLSTLVYYEKWLSGSKRVRKLERLESELNSKVLNLWQDDLRVFNVGLRVRAKSSMYHYIADKRHHDTFLWIQLYDLDADLDPADQV